MKTKLRKFCFVTVPNTVRTLDFAIFILAMMFISSHASAEGVNYLADLKADANATFGNGSDIPSYIYGGEAMAGIVGYIKTRSPMVFIGLPIVMMATHFGLKKAFG
jgi:hypothetical protein